MIRFNFVIWLNICLCEKREKCDINTCVLFECFKWQTKKKWFPRYIEKTQIWLKIHQIFSSESFKSFWNKQSLVKLGKKRKFKWNVCFLVLIFTIKVFHIIPLWFFFNRPQKEMTPLNSNCIFTYEWLMRRVNQVPSDVKSEFGRND